MSAAPVFVSMAELSLGISRYCALAGRMRVLINRTADLLSCSKAGAGDVVAAAAAATKALADACCSFGLSLEWLSDNLPNDVRLLAGVVGPMLDARGVTDFELQRCVTLGVKP